MNLAMLAFVVALGPRVAVEVDVDSSAHGTRSGTQSDLALTGWLSARLIEEGYDVAANAQHATATVRVTRAGTGLAVDAVGDGVRSFAVEAGPQAVQRLEVLHRALQGVEAVTASFVEPPRGVQTGLVVQLSGRPDESLLTAFVLAARDAGTTLHARAEPGDQLVCIATRGGLAEIGHGPAEQGCAPADTVAAIRTAAERQTAVDDVVLRANQALAASSLAAQAQRGADPVSSGKVPEGERRPVESEVPADPSARTPVLALVRSEAELVPMQGPARAEVRLGVEGGIVVRGVPDAAMRGRVRIGRVEGLGGRFEMSLVPSRSGGLRVTDTFVMAGPDWQMDVGRRARLMFAASAGADIHTFTSDQVSAAEVNWALALPVGAALRVRGGSRVHVMVHPGMSGISARHQQRNAATWERAVWQVGVAVGFSHAWRIE